jgi:HK97 family phage major capsid protein/HK97 family phage prohead protease
VERAYSLLEIKSVAAERRTFSGIASTPELDRAGDMVDPAGVTFRNPLPLLYHHDPTQPIGSVILTATPAGILFEATLPIVDEPGPLKTRVDDAWQCIKAGVITGVSVGHRILQGGAQRLASGARKVSKTEICELSLVTIPANANASILLVKSLAPARRTEKSVMKQTATEHIQNLENKRAVLASRMTEIMEAAAGEGKTLEAEPAEEHDGLTLQVKSIDADLGRWREMERLQITTATAVPAIVTAGGVRPFTTVSVRPNVEPGIRLARWVIAKLNARYENCTAADYAERRWNDSTPEVALELKAAVAAGSTTDATWAKPLVNPAIVDDFLPLLRAATILGKIQGLREVPFNVNVPSQTAGSTIQWVGELKPKPVSAMAFAMENLGFAKVASIVVLSQELVRFSNPSAERLVRDSLVKDIAAFLDGQFINPAVAAVAGVNPASITNGAPTAAATTNPLADILGLINHFATNNIPVDGLTFILSPSNALALSFRTNLDGSPEFPGIGINGGTYKGLQFITSNTATTNVVALQPGYILYADDGGVTIDASTEASLQMDSAPASPVDATTVYASMFQMNAVALRAERFVNWKRVGTNSVKYLTATAWPSPTGTTEFLGQYGGEKAS